jgi:hypothetical protein
MSDPEFDFSSGDEGSVRGQFNDDHRFVYVSSHVTKTEARVACSRTWMARFKFVYTSGSANLVQHLYRCSTHVSCQHFVRITESGNTFVLEAGGEYGLKPVSTPMTGINPVILPHVDALIHGNLGAMQVLTRLEQLFAEDPSMLAVLPNRRQVAN